MKRKRRAKKQVQLSQKKLKQMMLIIAAIIIPAFILWGVGSAIQSNKRYFIGKIGKWTITMPMWNRIKNHVYVIQEINAFNKPKLAPEAIDNLAWNRLVLLYLAQKKEHIKVKDRELAEYIASIPAFLDRNNKFSVSKYKAFLSSLGIPEKEFEETLREDLLIERLKEKVAGDITVSDKEIRQEWQNRKESFDISYKSFPFSEYISQVSVSEEEIKAYYDENKNTLIIPEKVNVEYILFPIEKLKDIKHKKKTDIESLAKELKLKIRETGYISRQDFVPEFGFNEDFYNYAFSLKEGQSSPLLETEKQAFMLRVKDIKEKHIATLKEARDRIKQTLTRKKALELAHQSAERVASASMEKTAEGWKDIQGLTANQYYLPGIGMVKPIIKYIKENCLGNKQANICGPIETNIGWVILKIKKFHPAPEPGPEDLKKIKAELKKQKQDKEFSKYLDSVLSTIRVYRKKGR